MSILHTRTGERLTLTEALRQCRAALAGAVALLYSPKNCVFARLDENGDLCGSNAEPLDVSSVYEARVFNDHAELRWLNDDGGRGRAALLSEGDIANFLTHSQDLENVCDTLPRQYLLWGEGALASQENWDVTHWSYLAMARIGRLAVPHPGMSRRGERIHLHAREYLAEVDAHGNIAVV